MADYLIMCEGITDQTLIGQYLCDVSGWKYVKIQESKRPINSDSIVWYKREEDRLGIGRVDGDDFHPMTSKIIEYNRRDDLGISKYAIVTDNDSTDEIRERFKSNMALFESGFDIKYQSWDKQDTNKWIPLKYKNGFSEEKELVFCFLTVPLKDQGALETYMLNALANNRPEGKLIADESNRFIDELKTAVYLRGRRDKVKAKLGTALSVFDPDRSVNTMVEIVEQIDWIGFNETNKQFVLLTEM